jgi:hypothetical protein
MERLGQSRGQEHFSARTGAVLVVLAVGCGGVRPAPPAAHRPSVPPAARSMVLDGGWAERLIWRVPVEVTLPDAAAWRASPSGTFTLLEHPRSRSRLALRVANAPRLVRPEQCESDARLARPSLPRADPGDVVERRTLSAPLGFDVRLTVGAEPSGTSGVHGWALAVGAATGRCYVAAFETDADGARAAEDVADRLALVVSGVLDTVRIPTAEGRVHHP